MQCPASLVGCHFNTNFTFTLTLFKHCYCRYLLILDKTHWRTKMTTSLLVPYIFLSLPSELFYVLRWCDNSLVSNANFFIELSWSIDWIISFIFCRGDIGKWIALIAVVLRLFFPRHFPGLNQQASTLFRILLETFSSTSLHFLFIYYFCFTSGNSTSPFMLSFN